MASYPITWWKRVPDEFIADGPVRRIVYICEETGEKKPSHELPYGACYELDNSGGYYPIGFDGASIACIIHYKVEGRSRNYHVWYIDGRASNCTKPDDNEHRCWCRHGSYGEPLHVDKIGNTCQAGAGSIAVSGFHGFLHNGLLYDC